MVAGYCPRCGFRDLVDPSICWACSDGVADAERAEALIVAAAAGSTDALRVLGNTTDPRAFEPIARAAGHADPAVRRKALVALGRIRDPRATAAAAANLDDEDDRVREAAYACLAELGPGAAERLVKRLGGPRDPHLAAVALAWHRDPRAIEPLAMLLDVDDLIPRLMYSSTQTRAARALGWLGGPAATAVLVATADRLLEQHRRVTLPFRWQAQAAATAIGQVLSGRRDPDAVERLERLRAEMGPLYVAPAELPPPFRAPEDPRRTVPRWSFTLRRAEVPVTEPVAKFGGQPVWLEGPTWPLGADGLPAVFWAQFTIPGRDGLAYLFLDPSGGLGDEGILFVQPGGAPERWTSDATGPTFASELQEPGRFEGTVLFPRIESRLDLEEGRDFSDWAAWREDSTVTRDDERDWNKIGGTPQWLQTDDAPTEPGWSFLFQFTAASVGREMGDGAEAYGFIHDDGRGFFTWQSH